MKFVFRFIVVMISVFLLSRFLSGFTIAPIGELQTIFIVTVLLTLLHLFIKPIIRILTLPINLLTFGLFSIIINALLLWGVAWFVTGFQIETFMVAVISSLCISFITFLFGYNS